MVADGHFYRLSPEERAAATARAMEERLTLVERWQLVEDERNASWLRRAKVAAKWLHSETAVADIGCGAQSLRSLLGPDVRYVPVDVVARDAATIVVDLNRDPVPSVPARAAAALGLFEYIFEPATLAAAFQASFDTVVVTYHPVDVDDPVPDRRVHGWVNALDTVGFEALFTQVGFHRHVRYAIDRRQVAWLFKSTRRRPGERPGTSRGA